jgi:hypothetical protein
VLLDEVDSSHVRVDLLFIDRVASNSSIYNGLQSMWRILFHHISSDFLVLLEHYFSSDPKSKALDHVTQKSDETKGKIETNAAHEAVSHQELGLWHKNKICEANDVIADQDGGDLVQYLLNVSEIVGERHGKNEVNQIQLSCKDEEDDLDRDLVVPVEQAECEKELSQYEKVIKHQSPSIFLQVFVEAAPLFIILPFSTCHQRLEWFRCGLRALSIHESKFLVELPLDEQREYTDVNEENNRKGKPKGITELGVNDVTLGNELESDQT